MEIILNSNENKTKDNCLRYNFKQPIRFMGVIDSSMEIVRKILKFYIS